MYLDVLKKNTKPQIQKICIKTREFKTDFKLKCFDNKRNIMLNLKGYTS